MEGKAACLLQLVCSFFILMFLFGEMKKHTFRSCLSKKGIDGISDKGFSYFRFSVDFFHFFFHSNFRRRFEVMVPSSRLSVDCAHMKSINWLSGQKVVGLILQSWTQFTPDAAALRYDSIPVSM